MYCIGSCSYAFDTQGYTPQFEIRLDGVVFWVLAFARLVAGRTSASASLLSSMRMTTHGIAHGIELNELNELKSFQLQFVSEQTISKERYAARKFLIAPYF